MDENDTTNPVEDADVSETEVEEQVQETEPQLDEDGNPIEDDAEPEEEEEEIDLDGVKLKLKKADAEKVKAGISMQADYTRKTQELAESRKAFEAERDAVQQASGEELSARANLNMIDGQLAQYQQVNWTQWRQQAKAADADNFDRAEQDKVDEAFQQFQLLKDARGSTVGYLQHLESERRSKQQQAQSKQEQAIAKLKEEGTPELKKAIPDWSPATANKLVQDSEKAFNIAKGDLAGADSPGHFLLLKYALKGLEAETKAKKAATIEKQQEVKPAAKVGGAAPKPGLDDRLSAEEWVKRREAQLRKTG